MCSKDWHDLLSVRQSGLYSKDIVPLCDVNGLVLHTSVHHCVFVWKCGCTCRFCHELRNSGLK